MLAQLLSLVEAVRNDPLKGLHKVRVVQRNAQLETRHPRLRNLDFRITHAKPVPNMHVGLQ